MERKLKASLSKNMEDFEDDIITSTGLNRYLPWYSCNKEEWVFTRRKYLKKKKIQSQEAEVEENEEIETNNDDNNNDDTTNINTNGHATQQQTEPKSWASIVKKNVKKEDETESDTKVTSSSDPERAPVQVETTLNGAATNNINEPRKPLGEVISTYTTTNNKHPEIKPRGLINTGNLCFMNSILQSLVYCEPFYNLLQRVSERVKFNLRNTQSPVLDGLIDFIKEFRMNNNNDDDEYNNDPFSPESFYKTITKQKKFDHLQRGRQEDAQEFLGYLLESIHEEFVYALKEYNNSHPLNTIDPQEGEWVEVGSNSNKKSNSNNNPNLMMVDTPISKLFGGEFQSSLKISQTLKPSITNDPFQHVQLDISDDRITTIEDAFRQMSQTETIPYKINNGEVVNATKQVLFKTLPKILIIHLKRFIYQGNESKKMSKTVKFDKSLQVPTECLTSELMNNRYQLFSVVYHHGPSSAVGHYTVDVKAYSQQWINIDDIILQRIENPERLGEPSATQPIPEDYENMTSNSNNKTAYLLFYVKLD